MNADRNKYLRAIFGAAREHGISYDDLHEAIWAGFQKRSLKDLSSQESRQLLDGIRGKRQLSEQRRHAMAKHGRRSYNDSGETAYLISDREMQMLRSAAAMRNWSEETLRHFIARQIGSETMHTLKEFNKVFWPLKAMNRRDGLMK